MKLSVLDIPEDAAERPRWLERHLVGLDLAELVAELEAVHGRPRGPAPRLKDVLGGRLEAVLASGLSELPAPIVGELLRRPRLLLELQERILTSGGPHWDRVGAPDDAMRGHIDRGGDRLRGFLEEQGGRRGEPAGRDARPGPPTLAIAWYRRPAFVAMAAAASVLAAVALHDRVRTPADAPAAVASAGWGWDKPGALPRDLPPKAYLNRLADEAGEWFSRRPERPVDVARRIADFRRGCSTLILSDHRPLSAADRAWLLDHCRTWAARLDGHLTALESGRDPLAVRSEADATVRGLIAALRDRAKLAA